MIASMRDFNEVIVFSSIICPRYFTRVRVRKKCDFSVAAFVFSLSSVWWCLSNTKNFLCFVCYCMKTSPKYNMTILLRMSRRKILLINAKKAGPMDIQ